MKKRLIVLTLAAVMGMANNIYAEKTQEKTAKTAAAAVNTDQAYNYDWDYKDFTCQFTWKSDAGDKAYISGDRMVLFNNSGRQTNTSKFSLAGYKPMTYFTEGNYHYFLTGRLEKNRLVYRLNKVDEYSHVKMAEVSVDMYSGFDYKAAFSDVPVRYSWDSKTAVFEICPDAEDTHKAKNDKKGYLKRSPMLYVAFDIIAMQGIEDSNEFTKGSSLKMAMYNGKYDSTPYAAGFYDFVLGGSKQEPKLFFNGTQLDDNGYVRVGEPQNFGNNTMFKSIYDSIRGGLYVCIAPTKGDGRPLAFDETQLAVQAGNNKDSLIIGDIMEYGDSLVITGKDVEKNNKQFKNAFAAYYNTQTQTRKKVFITDYKAEDGIKVSTPYCFSYNGEGRILWYETDKSGKTVIKWTKLKKSGGTEGSVKTVNTAGIVPVRPLNNNVYVYYITKDTDGKYRVNEFKYK